jgi:exonuclease SbcC
VISYIRLSNFRRHADTELHFEDSDQVVLVSGSNGVGKSTLFEAVLYALYGESRNGRGNIERIIRKGGELEGLEVELHFDVAGVSYEVKRRRDSKLTSAILYANEVAITEGAREVTAEVTKILGMDSRGFKLATYAQQKELDGLASMRPADRGQTLSRLLRLDVITRAKELARAEFRQRRDVLRALGTGRSTMELEAELTAVQDEAAALNAALDAARAQLAVLDAEIAAGGELETAYQAAKAHLARLDALAHAAEVEVARATAELENLVVPEPIQAPERSAEDLRVEAAEVEKLIAEGEARNRQLDQIKVLRGEVARCEQRLDEIDEALATAEGTDLEARQLEFSRVHGQLEAAGSQRVSLREAYVAARERVEAGRRERDAAANLEGECRSCGQSISAEHQAEHLRAAEDRLAAAEREMEGIHAQGLEAKRTVESLESEAKSLEAEVRETLRIIERSGRLGSERGEVVRRRDVYLGQLERLGGEAVDLQSLYTRRAEIMVEANLVAQAREVGLVRAARLEQRATLERGLAAAVERLGEHTRARQESDLSLDLELAHERLQLQTEARRSEAEIASDVQASLAAAGERERGIRRDIERVREEEARRAEIDGQAQVSMYASQVLERVESTWAQQLRPALEGTVSELVGRLSEGRFDAVQFDSEYNVSVRDRGVVRPISDLSGGETDLVALAVRLGLASVVSERHGAGGAGFLILDECFGSQDPARRLSILNALRGLKQTHGQIFLISHVGGLEDAADAVIEVELDDEANAVAVRA